MRKVVWGLSVVLCIASVFTSCMFTAPDPLHVDRQLNYCGEQVNKTLAIVGDTCLIPRSIDAGKEKWYRTTVYDWASGFWPGILWYSYEASHSKQMLHHAEFYTSTLEELLDPAHNGDHDLGFQFYCSFGNAYRLTKNEHYKKAALQGAEKLIRFFNPKVGTIHSWPWMQKEKGWPHNTIMDNMMNLELLYWAARNGGGKKYYDIATSHAQVTMKNHFRPDGSGYHVVVYDTLNGKFLKGVTNQGYSDESMWARGQAWAIYGYTMVYRETQDKTFLRFAEKVTEIYLKRLPDDYIPYWDFDDPAIPNAPKDASAAAIVASALLELSKLEDNKESSARYRKAAEKMLLELSGKNYQSRSINPAFLLHSTGNYPGGYEIDASINYADYYYIEALIRYKRLKEKLPVLG